MSLPMALAQGTRIGGQYIVGPLMNSGGFGAVYRGTDTSEGNRPCAIKETYDVTPAARRQALMEASVLFTVRSKHLPQVYDAFEANGRFYLVMQLIEGQNLLDLLRSRIGAVPLGEQQPYTRSQGPCSEQEVLSWLLPIMDVLQELHSRNPAVIHRDIKPGNIILTPDRTAVLVDFGLTRLYDPKSSTQTMVRAVSAGFSPLEQYVGKTSPQSDIYAMAATMYLLLTNRLPPAAPSRSMQDTLIAPRLLNPALSPKTERVLLKALAVNADQRYQSMRDFAQALQAPAFTAHDDPTIAVAPMHAQPKTSSAPNQAGPQPGYSGNAGSTAKQPRAQVQPKPRPPRMPSPPFAPSGNGAAPQAMMVQARPLPTPSNQGCLWGMMQGVLAAVLVFFLKQDAYFYLAIFTGFAFYVLAGFMTTRRGGPAIRGAQAGIWAGFTSTVIFWVVLSIELFVGFVQRIWSLSALSQRHGVHLPPNAAALAWRAVAPVFLLHQSLPFQRSPMGLLIYLATGLLLAFAFGLAGGLMGRARLKARMGRTKQPYTI